MDKADQMSFIKEHCDIVRDKILMMAQKNKMPEHWEEKQVKQYIGDTFSIPTHWLNSRERADFKNDVLINNL